MGIFVVCLKEYAHKDYLSFQKKERFITNFMKTGESVS